MTPEQLFNVWVLFYLGIVLQMLCQARTSTIRSFRDWLGLNWKELAVRLAFDDVWFVIWLTGPHLLGEAAARMIPPCSYVVAPWIGFSADRFTQSLGLKLRFTTVEP